MPKCRGFDSLKGLTFDDTGRYEPFNGGTRLAAVTMRKGRKTFTFNLGGAYATEFRLPNGQRLATIEPFNSAAIVVWTVATFIGRHNLLGDIYVRLDPRESSGKFESTGRSGLPAVNTNEFYFQISLPRLGKVYSNQAPLVNRAEISSIPPEGSLYELVESVRFENPINPNDWCDITKCYVLIPDRKDIDLEVISIIPDRNRYHVQATLQNRTESDTAEAYWFTHSEEPFNYYYEPDMGVVKLKRDKYIVAFDMVFTSPPKDPTIQIGAALISNPIVNDPHKNTSTNVLGINVAQRISYLSRRNLT